jgi:hypothetical protein
MGSLESNWDFWFVAVMVENLDRDGGVIFPARRFIIAVSRPPMVCLCEVLESRPRLRLRALGRLHLRLKT